MPESSPQYIKIKQTLPIDILLLINHAELILFLKTEKSMVHPKIFDNTTANCGSALYFDMASHKEDSTTPCNSFLRHSTGFSPIVTR